MREFPSSLSAGWPAFVTDVVSVVDQEFKARAAVITWRKADGSRVTDLDLRLDTAIRICIANHFPDVSVLSEEIGLLTSGSDPGVRLAIVDPVDGTDSLIQNRPTWWVSVGFVEGAEALAGLVYQPSTGRLHHTGMPSRRDCDRLVIGMSSDRLRAPETSELRFRLERAGAGFIGTPHAVEKVAAVVEGRCAASMYLPSAKSPSWRSWDLAAASAVADANHLILRTSTGEHLRFDHDASEHREPWICAQNEKVWNTLYQELRHQ